jgi:hypothetical protein
MVDRHSNSDHPRCMAAWRAALTQLAVAWGSHDRDPYGRYAFCHSSMETYLMTPSLMTVRCDHCRRELGPGVYRYWRMCFCSQNCMMAYQKRLTQETKTKIRHLEISRYSSFTKSSITSLPRWALTLTDGQNRRQNPPTLGATHWGTRTIWEATQSVTMRMPSVARGSCFL